MRQSRSVSPAAERGYLQEDEDRQDAEMEAALTIAC